MCVPVTIPGMPTEVVATQQVLVSLAWSIGKRTEPRLSSDLRKGSSGGG